MNRPAICVAKMPMIAATRNDQMKLKPMAVLMVSLTRSYFFAPQFCPMMGDIPNEREITISNAKASTRVTMPMAATASLPYCANRAKMTAFVPGPMMFAMPAGIAMGSRRFIDALNVSM